jgi:hypothetical protein
MVVILGKTGAYLQSGGAHACLTGAGWICAVDRAMDGLCGADAGVGRTVDHGPRVHGRPTEGVTPRSNPRHPPEIERLG